MMGRRWDKEGRGGGGRQQLLQLLLPLLLLLLMITTAHGFFGDDDDDDDLALSLGLLYRDSKDSLDPHDMLPGEVKYRPAPTSPGAEGTAGRGGTQGDDGKTEASAGCEGEEEVTRELSDCLARKAQLHNSLEEEQSASLQLQKMLAKEGILDLQAFYKRAVQHLWNALDLEEGRGILQGGNKALVRQVSVRLTADDLEALHHYLHTETQPHKVDEFLQRGFTLQDPPPSAAATSLYHTASLMVTATLQAVKSLEVWLSVMCVGFVALGVWAVVLFVRDVQRELRWRAVLWMLGCVAFFICCLWHWRHMYKLAQSRRHAQMAKTGYAGIPEKCQPGASTSASVYDWVRVNIFGGPDECEKYFEQLMVDAIEEITPGMVISETLTRFFLQPLQHLGTEGGKLTTNFYQNVPPAYHLHATALFLGLLVVVLFYGCAYGINFPLGLGGILPMARQESRVGGDAGGLGREAIEQLKRDREMFLEESRRMLSDISRAVQGSQAGQQQQHQVLVTSSDILEGHLECLISRHLQRAMDHRGEGAMHTITSTPLRAIPLTQAGRQGSGDQVSQVSMLGDLSSSSEGSCHNPEVEGEVEGEVDEQGNPNSLLVSTDAVHPRVAGTTRVPCLPPKYSSSCSSSANSSPAPSVLGSPITRRNKAANKAAKLMRRFRSAGSAESPLSPPPSPSASTQSLGPAGLDEPDMALPPDSNSFLAEVRTVLDLSVNSGPPHHCAAQGTQT